jgi:hypothetical protein
MEGKIMKTYIYTIEKMQKGKKEINVYRIKNNIPEFIGSKIINTASYKGDKPTACKIISEIDNHKMTNCGYYLRSKNINIYSI